MFGDQLKIFFGGGGSSMFHAMWAMLLLAARCGIRYFAITSLIPTCALPALSRILISALSRSSRAIWTAFSQERVGALTTDKPFPATSQAVWECVL